MPSSTKENMPASTLAMDNGDVFGSSAPSDMMLSPPPEEELRYTRRPTNEPSSASKPLASSMRTNQQSPLLSQASKRKRTITTSSTLDPAIVLHNQQESANTNQHTPNPRVRKQVRHAVASPNPSQDPASLSSPLGGGSRSRVHIQDDAPMTPTRKGKSRGRSTELVPESPYAENPDADYIPPSRLAVSPRGVNVRRRSVTPIPPYEPPKERYTPPREIIVSPPVAAERKARRSTGKKKRVTVKTEKPPVQLRIKTEPPEVDLTTPAPPASPSEDPILLVGPPTVRVQRPSTSPNKSHEVVNLVDFEMDLDLLENRTSAGPGPNQNIQSTPLRSDSSIAPAFDFSRVDDDDVGLTNNGWSDTSSDADFGTVVDNGLFANVNDDGWSDSDEENDNGEEGTSIGEGDFTGKFVAYKAPVKLDPPDNEGDRMEAWARPISPHPKRFSLVQPKEEDEEASLETTTDSTVGQSGDEAHNNGPSVANEDHAEQEVLGNGSTGYEDKRGRRLTLSEVEAMKFGSRPPTPKTAHGDNTHQGEELERDESFASSENSWEQDGNNAHDASIFLNIDQPNATLDEPSLDNVLVDSTQASIVSYRQQNPILTDEEHEVNFARSASEQSSEESSQTTLNNPDVTGSQDRDHVESDELQLRKHRKNIIQERPMKHDASFLTATPPPEGQVSDCETEIATDEEPEHDSEDRASDVSVVKIMSDDPMAAARAAAILKMHDYDMVARKLRRRRTTTGGVSKAYSAPKDTQLWRRRTVAGLGAEDSLADNVALPKLLEKAEEELRNSPARSRSGSLALSSIGSPQKSRWNDFMYEDADPYGVREWTKADWKLLDSCFTDERYDLGEQQGLGPGCLADVDDVPLESVIERFIELKGGVEKVESHGPSWTMEKLMGRVTALCKRQRSGNGAPPTPDVSARFSTPSRFPTLSPSTSMIVPDFTPRGAGRSWLFDSGSVSRKAALPPPSTDSFFKVPSTLPARHSRLRDEVDTTGLETPRPKSALDLFGFATPSRNLRGEDDSDDESVVQEVDAMLTPVNTSRMRQARPESAVKRSLSYITSWLKPDVYKSKSDERKGSQLPGLPVPPEDVLSKPRGPVETPAPKAAPKAVPHKELVSLEHIPPPPASKLPRRSRPRRLVDLNHVPTPQSSDEGKRSIPRRSSTSSVKDLVKEFEQREKRKEPVLPPRVAELRRQASVGSLKGKGKPTWKP